MTQTIKLYAHNACPQVPAVRSLLNGAQADYEYINIHEDNHARDFVREVNQGYESVPTLLFPDGSTLTEPSTGELKAKLTEIGYHVPLKAQIVAHIPKVIFWLVILYALLHFFEVI